MNSAYNIKLVKLENPEIAVITIMKIVTRSLDQNMFRAVEEHASGTIFCDIHCLVNTDSKALRNI